MLNYGILTITGAPVIVAVVNDEIPSLNVRTASPVYDALTTNIPYQSTLLIQTIHPFKDANATTRFGSFPVL